MLLRCWLDITAGWQSAFRQQRSFRRALGQALGILAAFGRRTLSRALWAQGRQLLDWSADYRLHARAAWQPQDLFQPILARPALSAAAVTPVWQWTTPVCTRPVAGS